MSTKQGPIKINGFSQGITAQQVFSYIIILAKIIFFSIIIVPHFIMAARVILSLLYYSATFMVILFGFMATNIDPTDEAVINQRKCEREGKVFDDSNYPYQCEFCKTSVHEDSKHCRVCDRCVTNFDHHCNWINNCVSDKNYKAFIYALIFLALSTFLFALAGVLFTIDYYTYSIGIIPSTELLYRHRSTEMWQPIMICIFSGIGTIFFILDARLIFFHMYLHKHNLTTYEYILKQRALKESLEEEKPRKSSSKSKKSQVGPAPNPQATMNSSASSSQAKEIVNNIGIMPSVDDENPRYQPNETVGHKREKSFNKEKSFGEKADSQRGLSRIVIEKHELEAEAETKGSKEELDRNIQFRQAETGIDYDLPEPTVQPSRSKIRSRSNVLKKPKEPIRLRNDYHIEDGRREYAPFDSNTHLKSSIYASFDSPITNSRYTTDKASESTPRRGDMTRDKELLRDISEGQPSVDDSDARLSRMSSNINLLDVINSRKDKGETTPSKATATDE